MGGKQSASSSGLKPIKEEDKNTANLHKVAEQYTPVKDLDFGGGCLALAVVSGNKSGRLYVQKTIGYADRNELEKVETEIKFLVKLQHPCISHYVAHTIDRIHKQVQLILDYYAGGTLADVIKEYKSKNKRIPEHKIRYWIGQAAYGLKFLHQNNVIHRDVKPSNLVLDENDNVRWIDFGTARILEHTKSITRKGTHLYESPELILKNPCGNSIDIWSLGVTIYELCMLKTPFDNDVEYVADNSIIDNDFAIKPIDEFYSNDLRKLVNSMLIRDPKTRLKTKNLLMDEYLDAPILREWKIKANVKNYKPRKATKKKNVGEELKIIIRSVHFRTTELTVYTEDTIKEVKQNIGNIFGIYYIRLRFICIQNKEELCNEKTVKESGIVGGTEIMASMRSMCGAGFFVITPLNKKCVIDNSLDKTVYEIKQDIEHKAGILLEHCHLYYNDKQLRDFQIFNIGFANIIMKPQYKVYIRKPGCVKEIRDEEGKIIGYKMKKFSTIVTGEHTVSMVKSAIAPKLKLDLKQFDLYYKGIMLDETRTLQDIMVYEFSVITLIKHKK